jgi:hypothetical protein
MPHIHKESEPRFPPLLHTPYIRGYIEQHKTFWKSADRASSLRVICLTTEEKARKTVSQGSRGVPAYPWEQQIRREKGIV